MKLTTLTILCSCFLLLASLVNGENKSVDKDKFMRINPNITNEDLRAELESLGREFDTERQRIRDLYEEKIQTLKDERRTEIKSMKNEFGERREAIFTKYGENRKKTKPAVKPNMEKREKGKKPLRKAK
jgi:hypothetical protein|tara:strand:- start:1033 stop:1419 length:387 start_codon:yes stop_codon:yes gene_type:complete